MKSKVLSRLNIVLGIIYFFTLSLILFGLFTYILSSALNLLLGNPPVQDNSFFAQVFNLIFDTLLFVFFIISLLLSSSRVLAYFFPQFEKKDLSNPPETTSKLEVVKFTSLENELLVINAIEKLLPRVYKFEIARETGLSRMKVHRNLLKLEERGIVEIEKVGKNSRVHFASWLTE